MSYAKRNNQRIMRKLCFVLLFLLIASQGIYAADKDPNDPNRPKNPNGLNEPNDSNESDYLNEPNEPNDPNELLHIKWNAIISVLQNKDIDQKEKEKQINKIVTPYFDFPLMSKLSLGREHWPKLTLMQRERFTRLFTERLKTSYRNKISLYKDEELLIRPKVQKKKTIYIPTELISKDRKLDILYKIRKVDKRWKIYDVEIQGVSILLTYRSQFDDILRKGTVEDLLSRLEKPPAE